MQIKISLADYILLQPLLKNTGGMGIFNSNYAFAIDTLMFPDALAPDVMKIIDDPNWKSVARKLHLSRHAADVRFTKETAGVNFLGHTVGTARDNQSRVFAACALAMAAPQQRFHWKFEAGEITELDGASMIALAQAVGAHVQACFAIEQDVAAKIANDVITDAAQIDAAFSAA